MNRANQLFFHTSRIVKIDTCIFFILDAQTYITVLCEAEIGSGSVQLLVFKNWFINMSIFQVFQLKKNCLILFQTKCQTSGSNFILRHSVCNTKGNARSLALDRCPPTITCIFDLTDTTMVNNSHVRKYV